MANEYDDILDGLFHGCAFIAYAELAIEGKGVPDSKAVKRLAYRYYEEALAEKNARERQPTPPALDKRDDLD